LVYGKEGKSTYCFPAMSAWRFALLQVLIENGVDVNCADYDQRTALHVAASRGRAEVAFFLLNCPNVDINPLDRSPSCLWRLDFISLLGRSAKHCIADNCAYSYHCAPHETPVM